MATTKKNMRLSLNYLQIHQVYSSVITTTPQNMAKYLEKKVNCIYHIKRYITQQIATKAVHIL